MSLRRPAAGGWSTSAGPAASIPVPAHELLAHVWRDGMVESTHSGSVAILDPGGNVELAIGDIEAVCYPRSALKPVQAAAMVRSGLVLPAELLAVAAASHSGERAHREAVERILSTHDMGACVLGNNAGFPLDPEVRDEWICAGHEAGSLVQN